MLRQMPALTSLSLEGNPWTGLILDRILEEGLVPRLESLALERADQFGVALLRLVEARSMKRNEDVEELPKAKQIGKLHILYKASDGYPDVDKRFLERHVGRVIIERTWS